MTKHPYIEYLEERRDALKVLVEGAGVLLPKAKKALQEKMDRDTLELLESEGKK